MIKTVKVKKKMRLDDLIKYVRDNGINSQAFVSDAGRASVYFDSEQNVSLGEYTYGELDIERIFTFEVEEEIAEDTAFDSLIEITADGVYIDHGYNISVSDVKGQHSIRFYALIDKKLELIWEAE